MNDNMILAGFGLAASGMLINRFVQPLPMAAAILLYSAAALLMIAGMVQNRKKKEK